MSSISSLDYMRTDPEDIAKNKALHDINAILTQHGLSCAAIGLPTPTGHALQNVMYDAVEEAREGAQRLAMLNERQLEAFRKIIMAVDDVTVPNRCFYLDGPGGSGKTFLYSALLSFIRGICLTFTFLFYFHFEGSTEASNVYVFVSDL